MARIAAADYGDMYARAHADVQRRAALYAKLVNDALEAAPALATGFNAQSALATQLKTVAKMIAVRDRLDMSRQVFCVGVGAYDTHDDQLLDQPRLLGDLSQSLASFYAATVELGVSQYVTTFTQSDFGRSLTSNGDGSDHTWGGVQLADLARATARRGASQPAIDRPPPGAVDREHREHEAPKLTRRARYRRPRRVVGGPQPVVSGMQVPRLPFLDGPAAGRV